MTAQGSAYHRFGRALDRGNVTEALSTAAELQFVGLTEALELTLLLADGELAKYERAARRWHLRFVYESKHTPGGIARRTPTLGLPIRRGRRCSPR